MKSMISCLCCLFAATLCNAQLQSFTAVNSTVGSVGVIQFNNFAELGSKSSTGLEYEDVRGTCFWNKEWKPAMLILKGGKAFKLKNVKLNLYTNEVHYVDQGKELIAQNGVVRVAFYDQKDSTRVIALFQRVVGFNIKGNDSFLQLLNEGEIRLLKHDDVTLDKVDNGPMAAAKVDYKFSTTETYYLYYNHNYSMIKKLSKANLFEHIKLTDDDENWLKKNKNKLKNEEDFVAFLNYYNSNSEKNR